MMNPTNHTIRELEQEYNAQAVTYRDSYKQADYDIMVKLEIRLHDAIQEAQYESQTGYEV